MMSKKSWYKVLILVCCLSYGTLLNSCNYSTETNKGEAVMWSKEPAKRWQDALVSGNGTMGILVFGEPGNEQIVFNHEECYEFTGTEDDPTPNLVKYMPKIKQLLLEGKNEEAAIYSFDMGNKEGWEFVWTDPYHPALKMNIEQTISGEYRNYSRCTNFETGEISINWRDDTGDYQRKSFVSRPDGVVVQQLSGSAPVNCKINVCDLIGREHVNRRQVAHDIMLKQPLLNIEKDWLTYRVAYQLYGRGYEAGTKVIVKDGTAKVENGEVVISGASEVLLLTRINFLEDYNKSQLKSTKDDLDKLGADYDALLKRHKKVHGDIYNRVKLDLNIERNKSTEDLIASQKANNKVVNTDFVQTAFNMGRYTLLSSSGKLPPNLSGIWQADFRPSWCGDFTLDANLNLQIAGAAIGNLYEATDAYMKLLERIAPDWETNAKQLYGCEGYFAGARTSGKHGLANHWGVGATMQFWTSGAEWLLLPAYEYYQTSGDEKFLKERLLPMMKKTVLFYEGFLNTYDENNNYVFVPSCSPENSPGNSVGTCASYNATIDIAAAKEAIVNLITVCKELNIEHENIARWEAMLKKFPPYLISKKGAIKEWATDTWIERQAHRHISHLYPVWPGHEIQQDKTPELFEAAKKAIRLREIGNGSAHGLAHRAFICARLKMDEEVYDCLRYLQTEGYFYRSMFSAHNARPVIYNADLINSYPAIIMEALVYSRPGFIELLPAWSHKLGNGKIEGVKCRTNATVESLEWDFDKMIIKAAISSGKNQTLKLYCKRGIQKVKCNTDYQNLSDKSISFSIKKGETLSFEIAMQPTVVLTPSEPVLDLKSSIQLETKVLPSKENEVVSYVSSDPAIASVDSTGMVQTHAEGQVQIKATSNDGITGISTLTVKKALTKAHLELVKDEIIQNDDYLYVTCKYNAETGTVIGDEGIRYTLDMINARKDERQRIIVYDKSAAGSKAGLSNLKIPIKNFPPTSELLPGRFYILTVTMVDENGNAARDVQRRFEIK